MYNNNNTYMKDRYLNGYKLIFSPNSPSAMSSSNWEGWAYEHRVIMERHLGRPLSSDEVVHHLDYYRDNNKIENLIVLSKEDHRKLHSYYDNDNKLSYKKCEHCGLEFKPQNSSVKYCSHSCASLSSRRCNRPSKEELEVLVWSYPFTELSKQFGVSDNAIRKWCKKYNITNLPPRGYFLRK